MSELAPVPAPDPVAEASADAAAPAAKKTRGAFFLRLGIAHLIAYPLAFAWAVACIPAAIALLPQTFVVDETLEKVVDVVLHRLAWPSIGVFVLEHLAVLPWAIDRGDRAQRLFWGLTIALGGIAIAGGGASWLWLVLR